MSVVVQCPKCGGKEHQPVLDLKRPSVAAFLLGGFLLMFLDFGRRKRKLRCVSCESVFYSHTKGTTAFLVLFIVLISLFILGTISVLMGWDEGE